MVKGMGLCSAALVLAIGQPKDIRLATKVEVSKTATGFQLMRGGSPYFIKGVVGNENLDRLKASGGNSIRIMAAAELQDGLLDLAEANGITVTVGIEVGSASQGTENVVAVVKQYKDHPAILMWSIGSGTGAGDDSTGSYWQTVNELARQIRRIDPLHPTMATMAEIGEKKLEMFQRHCRDVDILGISSYAGVATLHTRLKERGFKRPYLVAEFGTPQPLEVQKTTWGAPIEPNSTEKAEHYLKGYQGSVLDKPNCLGSYAFYWGNRLSTTSTWFAMFLPKGSSTGVVDVLENGWRGAWPQNLAPAIKSSTFDFALKEIPPAHIMIAKVDAVDPDGDRLLYQWDVLPESSDRGGGPAPRPVREAVKEVSNSRVVLRAPAAEGGYRLYCYVYDGKGHAATMNWPFFVKKAGE